MKPMIVFLINICTKYLSSASFILANAIITGLINVIISICYNFITDFLYKAMPWIFFIKTEIIVTINVD